MTRLLEKAFEAASELPEDEQNALAALILEEVDAETRWDESFARSGDVLSKLANEALEDEHAGRTKPLVPDDM